MSEEMTTTSLKAIFRFPFHGPNWQNRFLIGAALSLAGMIVPIVPMIFVYGYVLQVMRQAIHGEELTLPDWNDWGKLARDGLRAMLVSLVYLLPSQIVMIGGVLLYFAVSFAIPMSMAATEEKSSAAPVALILLVIFGSMAIMMLSMVVGWMLLFLGAIPLPLATAHFAVKDRVAAAFRVREWWPLLWRNKLGYFIAWVIVAGLMALGYLAFMLAYYTFILCAVVFFVSMPAVFYLMLVGAAVFGQTYRESAAIVAAGDQAAAS